jgi:hypothetical protein
VINARSIVVVLVLAAAVRTTALQKTSDLPSVLDAATTYVGRFINEYTNVVAEERYRQRVDRRTGGPIQQRELLSDFLLVKPAGTAEWLQFRDVIAVDDVRVADRNSRLVDLFVNAPPGAARERMRQVWEESARYNIGTLRRETNLPLFAIGFLQATYRDRFMFVVDSNPKVDAVISYRETGRPTVIRGSNNTEQPTHGRFWIDRRTGAVLKSELKYEGPSAFTTIATTFRAEPGFDVLVPSEMVEDHSSPRTDRITGQATYAKFRRFTVATEETLK